MDPLYVYALVQVLNGRTDRNSGTPDVPRHSPSAANPKGRSGRRIRGARSRPRDTRPPRGTRRLRTRSDSERPHQQTMLPPPADAQSMEVEE